MNLTKVTWIAMFLQLLIIASQASSVTDPGLILPETINGIAGRNDEFGSDFDIYESDMVVVSPKQMGSGALTLFKRTNDTWNQMGYIVPEPGEGFGEAVDISDHDLVVGGRIGSLNNAAYIFNKTIGEWTFSQKLTPPNFVSDEGFGWAVKIIGNHLFIGSIFHADANRQNAGAVWHYFKTNGTWEPRSLTRGSSTGAEYFGADIDASDEKVVIGAPESEGSGAVYIYKTETNGLTFEQVVYADDIYDFDFGKCVRILNNQMLVGSALRYYLFDFNGSGWVLNTQLNSTNPPMMNSSLSGACELIGNIALVSSELENNDNGNLRGAAYVFRKINGQWQESNKILDPTSEYSRKFGHQIKSTNDMTLISSHETNSGIIQSFANGSWNHIQNIISSPGLPDSRYGTHVESTEEDLIIATDQTNPNLAKAFVFNRIGNEWVQIQALESDNISETWPLSIGIYGEHMMIGVDLHNGIDFVRAYQKINGQWLPQQTIENTSWEFGHAIAIHNDIALVSARRESSGLVFVYQLVNGTWQETQVLNGSDTVNGDYFGYELYLNDNFLAIGAPWHNNKKGATYVFEKNQSGDWIEYQKLVHSDVGSSTWHYFGRNITGDADNLFIVAPGLSKLYHFTQPNGNNWSERQILPDVSSAAFSHNQLLVSSYSDILPGLAPTVVRVFDLISGGLHYRSTFTPTSAGIQNNYSEYYLGTTSINSYNGFIGSAGNNMGRNSGAAFIIDLSLVDIIFVHGME